MVNSFIANIAKCDNLKMPVRQPVKLIHMVFAIFTMFAIRNDKNYKIALQGVEEIVSIILIIRTFVLIHSHLLSLQGIHFQICIANIVNIVNVSSNSLTGCFMAVFETSQNAMFAITPIHPCKVKRRKVTC
jgi:hypothetical protein